MEKPVVKLVGEDSNIFNLLGLASRALKAAGQNEKAQEMFERATKQMSFDGALGVILEYVDAE